jgi:hypothetical protein
VIVLRCLAVGGFGSFRRADPSKLIVRGRGGEDCDFTVFIREDRLSRVDPPFRQDDRERRFQHDGRCYVARGVSKKR